MVYRKLSADEQRRALLRSANTRSNAIFTAGGKKREMKPITLPTTPWKDDGAEEANAASAHIRTKEE